MAGKSNLPAVVEIAFGTDPLTTGTLTWTDVSGYVKRAQGIDFSRGWDTETDQPLAGRLSLTLNNDDGRFTPGETGAYGLIRNRLPIRVSAVIGTGTGNTLTYDEAVGWYDMLGATYDDDEIGTVVLWTGLVETWRLAWENGVRSQVQVTAVDRWAALRRLKFDGDLVLAASTSFAADYFYPFTDIDTSWREVADRRPPVVQTGTSAPMEFRAVSHPTDAGKFVGRITEDTSGSDNTYQTAVVTGDQWSLNTGVTIAVVINPEADLPTTADSLSWGIRWGSSAFMQVGITKHAGGDLRAAGQIYDGSTNKSVVGTTALAVGQWHCIVLTLKRVSTTVTLTVHCDGVQHVTDTVTLSPDLPVADYFMRADISTLSYAIRAGLGGAFAFRRDLSASDAAFLSSLLAQWSGDTAANRAATLIKFVAPSPALTTTGTFTSTMSKQDLSDKSLADALMECATAEDGTLYMDAAGWPVLTSRSWRTGAAVAFTIPATALASDIAFTLDDQQLVNSSTVDRMVRDEIAATVRAKNETSVTTYGEQNTSVQIYVDTDAQLLERANAEANMWADPLVRSSDLTVDILTKNATIPAATMLGADIGQRVAVSGMPSEAPAATQFFIESIADRITHTGWLRTFTVSPRLDYFTIQDATFGALDSTNVLAF